MAKTGKYDELSQNVVELLGGKENISFFTHCVTRLRFNVKDKALVKQEALEKIDNVIGVQWSGEQFQIIIGQGVGQAYDQIVSENNLAGAGELSATEQSNKSTDKQEKMTFKSVIDRIFDVLSGTFVMFIPVLIAAGIISAILSLLTTFHLVSTRDQTYIVFAAVQQGIFYFLPLFAGYAASVKLKMNPFIGMALGAILCYSTINGAKDLSVFGLHIMTVTYSQSVFPIILGVWFMSYVERGLKKIVPEMLETIIVPAITLLLGLLATLLVLGPIGSIAGSYLGAFITLVNQHAGWLAPGLIGLIYPLMVFTGMHYALIPLVVTALANPGFDTLLMVAGFISNISEGGAAFATGLLEKDGKKKANAFTIAVSALCGVTEPALFGITFRNKRTLVAVCLGGFAGSLFAGILSAKAYGFVGGLPSLPLFIGPNGLGNLLVIVVAIAISFIVTLTLTYLLNKQTSAISKNQQTEMTYKEGVLDD
ncbi:hypothetical protein D6U18_01105 [Lactiplantibacillus pentosus]|uniref:PTS beta-glucoside transporter subunit EIIBCA n=1 Tax=Lactiplantibacillus pentosus TaxID=1589 RepID=A0ABD7IX68_LACPE|nr:PTS transporter subunit EIIC [Lactiplantibacillus pentosus]RMW52301.1 hypothetical protein D6U18_01105 [Lactiplantibacillus pentosus]